MSGLSNIHSLLGYNSFSFSLIEIKWSWKTTIEKIFSDPYSSFLVVKEGGFAANLTAKPKVF